MTDSDVRALRWKRLAKEYRRCLPHDRRGHRHYRVIREWMPRMLPLGFCGWYKWHGDGAGYVGHSCEDV